MEAIEATGLEFGREIVLSNDLTIWVQSESQDRYKVKIRIGGNLGRKLRAERRIRVRRKNLDSDE